MRVENCAIGRVDMRDYVMTNDDYTVIHTGATRIYYGYEETDEEGEWMFVAETPEGTVRLSAGETGTRDPWDCPETLLCGIRCLIRDHGWGLPGSENRERGKRRE